ncbi:DUF6879 family protein [Dactylosporangium sp. NPDC000521]|uniref:DUF6879 family protein n=1 Tax=Dactylosporangium sp. NPDC000521 TaxID=3363975 RepID=UPI0036CCE71B
MADDPTFEELFANCHRSAVHMEMRDTYTPDDEVYLRWKMNERVDIRKEFKDWYDLMVSTTARGVAVRRLRIVSEPITDFLRHEYESTADLNLAAGEDVRWLPRRQASDLAFPGNDFWVFDDEIVRFGHFAGDGTYLGMEIVTERTVAQFCVTSFEAAWARAIEHRNYRPT